MNPFTNPVEDLRAQLEEIVSSNGPDAADKAAQLLAELWDETRNDIAEAV